MKFSFAVRLAGWVALLLLSGSVHATVTMPAILNDNMVIQRDMPVPVWGWALPGVKVTVKFNGQEKSATAGEDGKWMVKLDPMAAQSTSQVMTVSTDKETRKINNILIGEVWICSGQSNMDWCVDALDNGLDLAARAQFPLIRFIDAPNSISGVPLRDFQAHWRICQPSTIGSFSAVGYFFGRELLTRLNVPIGLIGSNWGATRIEPWTPAAALNKHKELRVAASRINNAQENYQQTLASKLTEFDTWRKNVELAQKNGKPLPPMDIFIPNDLHKNTHPSSIYNAMIAPMVPFAIRGVIWYQGENNIQDGIKYAPKMKALIEGWRQAWGEGNFPFLFCQIAPFYYGNAPLDTLPNLWEAQYEVLASVANTGMASTVDIGNVLNIHPLNKRDVGLRLAWIAMAKTYGKNEVNYLNPTYKAIRTEKNLMIISFNNTVAGLKTKDLQPPREFELAGQDGKFYPAQATIKGKEVILQSSKVAAPVSVKYAWRNIADPNLINSANLPVLPFKVIASGSPAK